MIALEPCTVCQQPSAWRCGKCGPKCVAHVGRLPGRLARFRCGACGGGAELLRAHRSELVAFRSRLAPALQAPVRGRALLALVLAVLLMLPAKLLWFWVFLGAALAAALALKLQRSVAEGEPFDWPSPTNAAEELGEPLARLAGALIPVWLAAVFLVYAPTLAGYDLKLEEMRAAKEVVSRAGLLVRSPWFWAALLVFAAWTPPALAHALTAPSIADACNPAGPARLALRWKREWALQAGAALGLGLFAFAAGALTGSGFLGLAGTSLAALWGLFALGAMTGEFVHLFPDALGFGAVDAALVDLGDPEAPAPVEERAPAPAGPAVLQTTAAGRVAAALEAKDVRAALRIYGEAADPGAEFDAGLLLRLGQAAASVSEYSTAVNSLMLAAKGTGADAAKALVIAARIMDERLRDTAAAKRLFQQVVQRFPGTSAADFAARTLADPRFFGLRKEG